MDLDYSDPTIKIYGINVIPYYYYYVAKQSLVGAKKAIAMMGGEDECQPMLLGQRDMLELEVEYYRSQSTKFTTFLLTLIIFCVTVGILHYHYGVI